MLSKKNRIQNQRLIQKLGRQGTSFMTTHFIFKFLPSDLPDSKFAIAISKKIAPKAVSRNKLRRQITESLRHNLPSIPSPVVALIIQKKGTPEKLEYAIIDTEVQIFINQLKENV
ncbi:MAG: ribonuclease P protein component [Candidatus Peregrinibacteria bacterium]|nr:ribonuclease P protein component [Candidatus Peregrinibacteria bacterium]